MICLWKDSTLSKKKGSDEGCYYYNSTIGPIWAFYFYGHNIQVNRSDDYNLLYLLSFFGISFNRTLVP